MRPFASTARHKTAEICRKRCRCSPRKNGARRCRSAFPQYLHGLSEKSVQIFNNSRLGEFLSQVRAFPEQIGYVNSKGARPSRHQLARAPNILAEVEAGIEDEFKRVHELAPLRQLWLEPKLQNILRNVTRN